MRPIWMLAASYTVPIPPRPKIEAGRALSADCLTDQGFGPVARLRTGAERDPGKTLAVGSSLPVRGTWAALSVILRAMDAARPVLARHDGSSYHHEAIERAFRRGSNQAQRQGGLVGGLGGLAASVLGVSSASAGLRPT